MLTGIVLGLVAASLAGGVFFLTRAPAVSLALLGGLGGGFCGFFFSTRHDPKNVPADVAVWATCGLVALGLVGLLLRPRGPARLLRRAAVGVLAIGPVAAATLAFLLVSACPLYVTRHAGFCYYDIDVLGGWVSKVIVLFILDVFALAVLLSVSANEVKVTQATDEL
jgi:hypothetical protein